MEIPIPEQSLYWDRVQIHMLTSTWRSTVFGSPMSVVCGVVFMLRMSTRIRQFTLRAGVSNLMSHLWEDNDLTSSILTHYYFVNIWSIVSLRCGPLEQIRIVCPLRYSMFGLGLHLPRYVTTCLEPTGSKLPKELGWKRCSWIKELEKVAYKNQIYPVLATHIHNKANLRCLIAATGLMILIKLDSSRRFFSPFDLEIWWMTS